MEIAAKQRREYWAARGSPESKDHSTLESIIRHDKNYDECVRHGPEGAPVYDDMGYELSCEKCLKRRKTIPRPSNTSLKKEMERMEKWAEKDRKICAITGMSKERCNTGDMHWKVAKDLKIPYHTVDICDYEEWKKQGFTATEEKLTSDENRKEAVKFMTGSFYRK